MQLYQKKLYEWTEAAYRGWLSSRPTNLGDGGIWEDLDEDGETKNTFKGTCVKDLMFMMMFRDLENTSQSLGYPVRINY
jgi:hypothetical protein